MYGVLRTSPHHLDVLQPRRPKRLQLRPPNAGQEHQLKSSIHKFRLHARNDDMYTIRHLDGKRGRLGSSTVRRPHCPTFTSMIQQICGPRITNDIDLQSSVSRDVVGWKVGKLS